MKKLPPFDALIAFEAALRHGSMTGAGDELGITQSAVSHRIRRLEACMGVALLLRTSAGLFATPAGDALAVGLEEILGSLAGLRARCASAGGPQRLRIGVGAALADNWLVRRLPPYSAAHPDMAIELAVVENEAQVNAPDIDVRVLWLPLAEARASSTQRVLVGERVFPVCHPSLVSSGFVPGDPEALLELPLLHKGPPGRGQGNEWSWSAWLARLGLPARPQASLRFATIGTAISAAHQGAGAVLARSLLVHDAIRDGRLARLLPSDWDIPSSKAHVVRWPSSLIGDARVESFTAWLVKAAGDTEASCQAC